MLARMTWTPYETSIFLIGVLVIPLALAFAAFRLADKKKEPTTNPVTAAIIAFCLFLLCGIPSFFYIGHLFRESNK